MKTKIHRLPRPDSYPHIGEDSSVIKDLSKKIFIVAAGLLFSLAANAQKLKESDVPSVVKEVFKKKYTAAKEVKWEKEGPNFEAEFEMGETEQAIVYDPSGNLIEMEVEIKIEELPAATRAYISKNYRNSKIKEATKITDAKGMLSFEAEVRGWDLMFDANGKFIKEEKESHKD